MIIATAGVSSSDPAALQHQPRAFACRVRCFVEPGNAAQHVDRNGDLPASQGEPALICKGPLVEHGAEPRLLIKEGDGT